MECNVRGIPLYYEELGVGRPLLMLHGWPGDHRQMIHVMEPFFSQRPGWRRLYPDMPGMGRTPGADWITSQDQMLEVALGFLDAVAPDTRFAVAGVSYGGYLARGVIYHRRAQICGVLLSAPVVEVDPSKRNLPQKQVLVHNPTFVSALQPDEQGVLQIAVVQGPDVLAAFREAIKPGILAADHEFLRRVAANFAFSLDVDKLPEPCCCPTLIVSGRQDSACGYREAWNLLDNFPRGTFATLDRAGHALATEQKALYQALVSEWLDRVEEYSSGS